MAGLKVPDEKYVGRFRGEPGLETTRVWVGGHEGAPPERVASELAAFEQTLQRAVAALDAPYPRAEALDHVIGASADEAGQSVLEAPRAAKA